MYACCRKCENSVQIGNGLLGKPVYECKKLRVFIDANALVKCLAFTKKPIVLIEKEVPMAEEYLVREYLKERIP